MFWVSSTGRFLLNLWGDGEEAMVEGDEDEIYFRPRREAYVTLTLPDICDGFKSNRYYIDSCVRERQADMFT